MLLSAELTYQGCAMNEEVTQTAREAEMMAVIENIVEGGRSLIRDWTLLEDAETAMRNGGSRATWIKATLQAHGKNTLESEYKRFMAIYSGNAGQ